MVVVGTYNMSFAGDLFWNTDKPMPTRGVSEHSFHLRDPLNGKAEVAGSVGKRTFWNNAKEHLSHFIANKKPLAVGLQEMNLTNAETRATENAKAPQEGLDLRGVQGTMAITKMAEGIPDTKYKTIEAEKEFQYGKPALQIIYNADILTSIPKTQIIDNENQAGRPLLMAYFETEKVLLVNMHGAQDAPNGLFEKEFNDMMQNNKNFLEEKVNTFLGDESPEHIYIMGDFNDRYDAITEFSIKGKSVSYNGDSPKACCHNWDSMGKETEREKIKKEKAGENLSEKVQGKKSITINNEEKNGQIKIPEEHGINIADYINKGDKVFSSDNDAGELHIYTGDMTEAEYMNNPSNKSDHELVYMEIKEAPATEGAATAATEGAATETPTTETTTTETPTTETTTTETTTAGGWSLFKGGKRKSRKGRKSKKNKKSNRKTKKMARKSKKRGKK